MQQSAYKESPHRSLLDSSLRWNDNKGFLTASDTDVMMALAKVVLCYVYELYSAVGKS